MHAYDRRPRQNAPAETLITGVQGLTIYYGVKAQFPPSSTTNVDNVP